MNLISFLLNKFLEVTVTLLVISVIAFSIKLGLGDQLITTPDISISNEGSMLLGYEPVTSDHGGNIVLQYSQFLQRAVQGDLGSSYFYQKPALDIILSKFAATFELIVTVAAIVIITSIPLGALTALYPERSSTNTLLIASKIGMSVPIFVTAICLIYIFSLSLDWLPSSGRGQTTVLPWGWETGLLTSSGLSHLILPTLSLLSFMFPLFLRLVRADMLRQMREDYVRYALAKGLSKRRVWFKHAFRNTLLSLTSVSGSQFGILFAFTIITERVFNWPGIGSLFLEAVTNVDTPLIIAYVILVGLVFVTINALVDLLHTIINPLAKFSNRGY